MAEKKDPNVVDFGTARVWAEQIVNQQKAMAHMASFAGHDLSSQPQILRSVTQELRVKYDYRFHNSHDGNPLVEFVPREFAAWFGIGGPASYVIDRIGGLAQAGLSYFFFAGMPYKERESFAASVLPAVHSS